MAKQLPVRLAAAHIVVEEIGPGNTYQAYLFGFKGECVAHSKSEAEAIGKLIMKWPDSFGIGIRRL